MTALTRCARLVAAVWFSACAGGSAPAPGDPGDVALPDASSGAADGGEVSASTSDGAAHDAVADVVAPEVDADGRPDDHAGPCLASIPVDLALGGASGDQGYGVAAAADGDALLVGHTFSQGAGKSDVWLQRVGPDGAVVWQRTFGGAEHDVGEAVIERADGSVLAVGYSGAAGLGGADVWLAATTAGGAPLWERTLGHELDDLARDVARGDGYTSVVVGAATDPAAGDKDVLVLAVDVLGETLWERRHGSFGDDLAFTLTPLPAGGFAVAATTRSTPGGHSDAWLLWLDDAGEVVDEATFGGPDDDFVRGVAALAEGVVALTGHREVGEGDLDAWVLLVGPDGGLLDERTLGGEDTDDSRDLLALPDGGLLIAANTRSTSVGTAGESDAWLLRLDAHLDTVEARLLGGPFADVAHALALAPDGAALAVGYTQSKGAGAYDLWHLRLGAGCPP